MLTFVGYKAFTEVNISITALFISSGICFMGLIFISSFVKGIRRTFILSEQFEKFQKTPKYQELQSQINNMFSQNQNPTGFTDTAPVNADNEEPREVKLSPEEAKKQDAITKLNKMSTNDLRTLASKLYISGYDEMEKPELIKSILNATNNN
jgi:hypothetical protein